MSDKFHRSKDRLMGCLGRLTICRWIAFTFCCAVWLFGSSALLMAQDAERRFEYLLQLADERAERFTGQWRESNEPLPPEFQLTVGTDEENSQPPLPPLDEELQWHGGSYLYEPSFQDTKLLPHGHSKPKPVTTYQEFLGADPIAFPLGQNGEDGFSWEPRFVGYGSYALIGLAFDGNQPGLPNSNGRTVGIGQQLLVDLDLRLTGTERFHVQLRPIGKENTGGSLLTLDGPVEYDDNSTLIPERYWFEGELFSLFRGRFDEEFTPRDYHFVVGKFPFVLHNALLVNDELLGAVVNKNTLLVGGFSNLNVQMFYGFDDGQALGIPTANLLGTNLSADYRHVFVEATLAGSFADDVTRQAVYTAGSITRLCGPVTLAGRAMYRLGDSSSQSGGLYVLESNHTRQLPHEIQSATGFEEAVTYGTLFHADDGWQTMAGGNFDRLRSAFAVNPLVAISNGVASSERNGLALGVQLFRDEQDSSLIPEVALEEVGGAFQVGFGATYLRELGRRTFLDLRGITTWSDDDSLRQDGVFCSVFFVM